VPEPIRILIADDHGVLRSGLRMMLSSQEDMVVVGEAATGDEVPLLCSRLRPDLVLLDLSMPGMSSSEVIRTTLGQVPGIKFLVLTMHDDEHYLREVVAAGARGYILKKAADTELLAAIRSVHEGGLYIDPAMARYFVAQVMQAAEAGKESRQVTLSERERQVLKLLAMGYTYRQIGEELFISEKTVETYASRIKKKLHISRRSELVRYALKHGLIQPE